MPSLSVGGERTLTRGMIGRPVLVKMPSLSVGEEPTLTREMIGRPVLVKKFFLAVAQSDVMCPVSSRK